MVINRKGLLAEARILTETVEQICKLQEGVAAMLARIKNANQNPKGKDEALECLNSAYDRAEGLGMALLLANQAMMEMASQQM